MSPPNIHHFNTGRTTISTTTTPAPIPNHLEAANIAHFDALSHDYDTQHLSAAEYADRLTCVLLHRRSDSQTCSFLVLDEDATSVLDYACGSGIE
jgi:hypothetical protein